MSIRPVYEVDSFASPADAVPVRPLAAPGAIASQSPSSGTVPLPPSSRGGEASSSSDSSEDVVQVQRDPVTRAIVIRYLDRSGSVILEVPSEQLLNLARVISEELQRASK